MNRSSLTSHNLVIYQVYVRNHTKNGTFTEAKADLERIRSMGVDIVYFMPIHPIGLLNKKGSLGCPYSIKDYRTVNPEYGTLQDFSALLERAHQLGLRVMIDVVFNHTSHDSILVKEHPDWFHQDENGFPVTTVPEWSDVIDLKHPNPELSRYLIDSLKYWVEIGVDGFRCDVASLLPLDFWLQARREVSQINPQVIWLAESVHNSFISERRKAGLMAISDGELFAAFDMEYDYDIWPVWMAAVSGKVPVSRYLDLLMFQDGNFPQGYLKMRCVENHDQVRIMKLAPTPQQALAWTAFMAFNRGPFFIYAGQESAAKHTPSLFDIDKVDWGTYELQDILTRFAKLKKHPVMANGQIYYHTVEPFLQASWFAGGNGLYGVFNVNGAKGKVTIELPDGKYVDWLSGKELNIRNGSLPAPESAWIFEYQASAYPSCLAFPL